jgi:hypothetical protein
MGDVAASTMTGRRVGTVAAATAETVVLDGDDESGWTWEVPAAVQEYPV